MHKYQENHTIIATNGILTIYFFLKVNSQINI